MSAILLTDENPAQRRKKGLVSSDEATFVLLCASLAFIIRLFFVKYQYVINTDGVYYATLGRRLMSGDFRGAFSAYWSPLYPVLVGLASLGFADLEFAGRFVSVLAGALLVLPVYLLIREFYGRAAATVGALLAVVYPILVEMSTLLMTESVYTLAFTTALLFGWYGLKGGGTWKYAATGLLMGCCYLLKPEAVAYAGLFVMLALATWLIRKDRRFTGIAFNVGVLLMAFSVLALPYLLYIREKTGSWSISSKVVNNVALSQSPLSLVTGGDTTLWDQLYGDGVVVLPPPTGASASGSSPSHRNEVVERLRLRASRSYRNLKVETKEMIPELVPYSFIVLCIIGFFRSAWTRLRTAKELYLSAFAGSTLMGYAVTVVDTRYLVPVVPVFLCWISHGALEFESWVVSTLAQFNVGLPRPRALRRGVLTFSLLILLPTLVASARKSRWEDLPIEQKQAGLWMKARSPVAPLIMANGPWAAYYAGGRHLYLPAESYATVLSYARRKGVDYIVVAARCDTSPDSNSPPELCIQNTPLAFLLDETQAPPELQLLYQEAEKPEYKLLVYALRSRDEP